MSESHSNLTTSEPQSGSNPAVELSTLAISPDQFSQMQFTPDSFGMTGAVVGEEMEIPKYRLATQNQTVQAHLNFQHQQELIQHREMMLYQTRMTQMAVDVTGLMLKELEASRQFQKDMQAEVQKSRIVESETNRQFQKDLIGMFISRQATPIAPITATSNSFYSLQHLTASSDPPIDLLTDARPRTDSISTMDDEQRENLDSKGSYLHCRADEKKRSHRMCTRSLTAINTMKNGAAVTARKRTCNKAFGGSSKSVCQGCNDALKPRKSRIQDASRYRKHRKEA